MIETETLHEPPPPGESSSPCCGRTLGDLPRYDRIVSDHARVTCGRLSDTDALLLSGQPVILDPRHDELVYTMAATVVSLCGDGVSLTTAHQNVDAAIREIVPTDHALASWSTALMVRVTARAQELIGRPGP